jgi:hypothetical protein
LAALILGFSVGELAGVGSVLLVELAVGLVVGELAGESGAGFLIAFTLGLSMDFLLLVPGLSMEFLLLEAVLSMTGGDKALLANNAIAPTVPKAAITDKGMSHERCLSSDEAMVASRTAEGIAGVEFLEDVEP